jgi:hypothetical protein
MNDANAAAQLSKTTPTRSFDEMLRARSKEYAGNALYQQVIEDAAAEMRTMRKVSMPGGCFVAGTLVHTKEGLKPIENVKVGDWVLSQPEETGERSYKRVVRTLQFEDKEVWSVEIFPKSEQDQARLESRMINEKTITRIVVTGNHPFWVKDKGWTRADQLDEKEFPSCEPQQVEMMDGQAAIISRVDPIKRTLTKDVGWIQRLGDSDVGDLLDLSNGASAEIDFRYKGLGDRGDLNEGVDWWEPENILRCAVYNMEVEDFHTYYVGSLGVWVHNTNCDANIGEMEAYITKGVIPSSRPGLYFTKTEAYNLTGTNQGVILVMENVKNPYIAWVKFQRETEGVQLLGDNFLTFSYRYNNTLGGRNVIMAGDARALMTDGGWSMTTIDAKNWTRFYIDVRDNLTIQNNFIASLQKLDLALQQNKGKQ